MRNKKLVILTMAACITAGLAAGCGAKSRYRNNSCGGSREHRSRACGEQHGGDGSSWRFHRR